MRIAILSRAPSSYSTRRLVAAAEGRGHVADVLDVLKLDISLEPGYPDLYYNGKLLAEYDAAIPRIGSSITYFGTAAVRQLEQMDVFCANSALGIANSRDKLRCLQMLSRFDIGIPPTEFVRREQDLLPAIERVGGVPVVIKLLQGTQGIGVILAETLEVAENVIETLHSAKQNVLIQKFVSESRGRDIRAFVVGDRVIAASRRLARAGEFRSNIHRGGRAEPIQLDEEYEAAAVRAAQIVGLRVAGVDILEGADGPAVMEVNSTPGLQGIETATGIDVAGAIIDYVRYHVRLPDLDLRQRLTVSRGYGVAEIPIREGSGLDGRTVATSGLPDRDVAILTVHRGGKVIPNPRGDRVLEIGDRLLCYGKLETMRSFVPQIKLPRVRKLPKKPLDHGSGGKRES